MLWSPIRCSAPWQLVCSFLLYYSVRRGEGLKLEGYLCYRGRECEFWKDCLAQERPAGLAHKARERAEVFVKARPRAATPDYNYIVQLAA